MGDPMQKTLCGGRWARLWRAAPWLWIAAGYLLDLWYQLVPGKWIVDSDLASEMILADLLNREGSIISQNWYYSTELKVANLQWFYRLGLIIFPNDWHLARVFGMAITLALYAAVLLFLAKSANLGRAGLWMTGALLWPFGQRYLLYSIFGGYYLVYTTFYLLVLALLFRSLHATSARYVLWSVAAAAVALISGLNGVKQIMVFHAPFFLAAAVVFVVALHDSEKQNWKGALCACKQEGRLFAGATLTGIACGAGYLINTLVLAGAYSYKTFGSIVWNRSDDWFTLDRVIMDFFHEFGYQNGAHLFRFSGIATGLGLLLGGFLIFCIIRLLLGIKKLTISERLLILLLVSMILVCGISYTYFQEYNQYYWLAVFPIGVVAMAIELKTESFHLPGARKVMAGALAAVVAVCAIHTVRREIEKPQLAKKGLDTVADWLVENGYTQGYAGFWYSNALTGLSNGKIECWTLVNLDDDVIMDWLQKKDHLTTDPAGSPFLLLDTETDGAPEDAALIALGDCELVYEDGRYQVYTFASAADVHAAAEAARAEG